MDFFSYTRDANGALVYKYGYERIPENWYKRATNDPWTIADVLAGVAQQCLAYPKTCAIGGNTHGVNTFAGIDVGDISGGAFNASAFTDPEILGCFISQNIQAEIPTSVSQLVQGPLVALLTAQVTSIVLPALAQGLGECDGLNGHNAKSMASYSGTFPGAALQSDGDRAYSPQP